MSKKELAPPSSIDFLAPIPALMVRQQLQIMEMFCPCEQRNMYKMSSIQPLTGDACPDDKEFKAMPTLMTAHEESSCCCRFWCQSWREFKMTLSGVAADGRTYSYMILDRPFRCTMCCVCCLLNPQVIFIRDATGQPIGQVEQDWRICPALCCPGLTFYLKVADNTGGIHYWLRYQFPTCCNGCRNLCAPSCFNKRFEVDILTPDESTVVGTIMNIWPGCNLRCCSVASNIVVNFPSNASANDKALIIGGLYLIEYMLWERKPDDNNSGLGMAAAVLS